MLACCQSFLGFLARHLIFVKPIINESCPSKWRAWWVLAKALDRAPDCVWVGAQALPLIYMKSVFVHPYWKFLDPPLYLTAENSPACLGLFSAGLVVIAVGWGIEIIPKVLKWVNFRYFFSIARGGGLTAPKAPPPWSHWNSPFYCICLVSNEIRDEFRMQSSHWHWHWHKWDRAHPVWNIHLHPHTPTQILALFSFHVLRRNCPMLEMIRFDRGGGHLYFRLDIILVKGLSKTHPKHIFFTYENRP